MSLELIRHNSVSRFFPKVIFLAVVSSFILNGCGGSPRAPVIERTSGSKAVKSAQREPDWRPEYYIIKKGDTLYSVALDHGHDYREVAEWNQIDNPHVIQVGQQLRMRPPSYSAVASNSGVTTAPLKTASVQSGKSLDESQSNVSNNQSSGIKTYPKGLKLPYSKQAIAEIQKSLTAPQKTDSVPLKTAKAEPKSDVKAIEQHDSSAVSDEEVTGWVWPVNGKVLSGFSDSSKAKGVDISGKLGQPVVASAPGKVVYSGTGIRGFGKLIVIKHNKTYLSAYAHNNQLLVKEGQNVTGGQKIAEMGSTDTDQVKLHFEIRRLGKPVDPMKYLGNDKNS